MCDDCRDWKVFHLLVVRRLIYLGRLQTSCMCNSWYDLKVYKLPAWTSDCNISDLPTQASDHCAVFKLFVMTRPQASTNYLTEDSDPNVSKLPLTFVTNIKACHHPERTHYLKCLTKRTLLLTAYHCLFTALRHTDVLHTNDRGNHDRKFVKPRRY